MTPKERFINIYEENIKREGSDKLLEFLTSKNSDFFEAPASSRYHSAYEGGLVDHSLNVYDCMKAYMERERVKNDYKLTASDESIAIVALLHDLCKVNIYKKGTRNVKDEKGVWKQVLRYEFDDKLPYGHGEKSVYIITGFMRLSREEAFAIRYHMGFSGEENVNTVGNALQAFPLALAVNIADMEASFLLEEK